MVLLLGPLVLADPNVSSALASHLNNPYHHLKVAACAFTSKSSPPFPTPILSDMAKLSMRVVGKTLQSRGLSPDPMSWATASALFMLEQAN